VNIVISVNPSQSAERRVTMSSQQLPAFCYGLVGKPSGLAFEHSCKRMKFLNQLVGRISENLGVFKIHFSDETTADVCNKILGNEGNQSESCQWVINQKLFLC
jgi:hypothetical protein